MFRVLLIAATLCLAAPATAQDKAGAILTAWQNWTETSAIPNSAIAIGHNGDIVLLGSKGRDPRAPYPLASLSKAITAVCLTHVMNEHDLSLNTPIGDLAAIFARANVIIPPEAATITVASLMTHTSGLAPDVTQGTFLFNRNKARTNNDKIARNALAPNGRRGTFGDYAYNNGNYAILGSLLEGLTGTDNVTACRDRLFPAGNRDTAGFNDEWISFAAMGGWEASTADYLAFVMKNFGPTSTIARNPFETPHHPVADGIYYGTGTVFRHAEGQSTIWHSGAICNFGFFDQGSYFVQYANGYAVMVTYDKCGSGKRWRPLDDALFNAAHNDE